jgi:UMF1 family MFS transporter
MKDFNKEIKSWIFYDFGNSAYATTVIAAFFPLFYASYWSNGIESLQATQYLAFALTIINLIILVSAPIIGAVTDYKRLTKILFIIFTLFQWVNGLWHSSSTVFHSFPLLRRLFSMTKC